jgi:ABC-type transport system involved in multi-copper enzyme maturation permease subunit
MTRGKLHIGLPLLSKELLELSSRKRTYVLRVAYAAGLYLMALFIFSETIYEQSTSPLQVLGRGTEILQVLSVINVVGVYLFLPALACPLIAQEKERQTIGLLLLTKLGPWTILLEKYFSRCLAMLMFLTLSLPLLPLAYALGGVSTGNLAATAWMLLWTTLQVGAFAVMCSCLFRTTVGAFVATYVLGFLFYFGPALVASFLRIEPDDEYWFFAWVPPAVLQDLNLNFWPDHVARGLPILLSTLGLLVIARLFLVRQAFAPPRNPVLNQFRKLDRLFERWNQNRLTAGRVLFRESTFLPDEEPIAWRETQKKSLGTVRYLVRVFLVIEVPVLFLNCLIVMFDINSIHSDGVPDSLMGVTFILWVVTALFILVKGTSLIAGERSHHTLDVLLTTPLTGTEILQQKMRGLWRLVAVVSIPLVTTILFQAWCRETYAFGLAVSVPVGWGIALGAAAVGVTTALWLSRRGTNRSRPWSPARAWGLGIAAAVLLDRAARILIRGDFSELLSDEDSPLIYLASDMLTLAIYLPLLAWISVWIGLRMKSQSRALVAATAVVVGWCVVPLVLLIPLLVMGSIDERFLWPALASPATIVAMTEFGALDSLTRSPVLSVLLNSLWYGFWLRWIRERVRTECRTHLGRSEPA